MRTTLTLEPDVSVRLERLRATSDRTLKEVVNDTLRRGLDEVGLALPGRRSRTGREPGLSAVPVWSTRTC